MSLSPDKHHWNRCLEKSHLSLRDRPRLCKQLKNGQERDSCFLSSQNTSQSESLSAHSGLLTSGGLKWLWRAEIWKEGFVEIPPLNKYKTKLKTKTKHFYFYYACSTNSQDNCEFKCETIFEIYYSNKCWTSRVLTLVLQAP